MDFKTTILKDEIKTEETLLPEIPELHFGIMGERKAVFDYTSYIEECELPAINYKVFMRVNQNYIETLAKANGKKTSELFFQNPNGHILVAAELVFIFLAFINSDMLIYFNSLLTDAISDGIAFSHGFIYNMAEGKLPSDVLADIIKNRENDAVGSE